MMCHTGRSTGSRGLGEGFKLSVPQVPGQDSNLKLSGREQYDPAKGLYPSGCHRILLLNYGSHDDDDNIDTAYNYPAADDLQVYPCCYCDCDTQ